MGEHTSPPCEYCGSPQKNCGPPINEDYCTNPSCTGMRDAMFANVRERVRKDRALREAGPLLLAQLEKMVAHYVQLAGCGDCGNWDPEAEEEVIAARAAIAKARGEARTQDNGSL